MRQAGHLAFVLVWVLAFSALLTGCPGSEPPRKPPPGPRTPDAPRVPEPKLLMKPVQAQAQAAGLQQLINRDENT